MADPSVLTVPSRSGAPRAAGLVGLWASELFGSFGLQITLFLVPLVAVTVFDANALQIGALNSLESVAAMVFGLLTGALIDRLGGSWAVVLANLVRAAAAGVLLVGLLRWHDLSFLYLACILVGVGCLANDAGISTAVAELSDRGPRELNRMNALLRVTTVAAEVSGPGAGGLLILSVGVAATAGAAAVTFGLAAGVLAISMTRRRIKEYGRGPSGVDPRKSLTASMGAQRAGPGRGLSGARFIWGHPTLRPLVLSSLQFNFFSAMVQAVFIIYCIRELHFTTGDLAFVGVAGGVGGLVGGLIASANAVALRSKLAYVVALSTPGICVGVLVLVSSTTHGTQVAAVATAMGIWSTAMVICLVLFNTIRQLQSPRHLVGRVASTERVLALAGELPGALIGGLVGTLVSPTPILILGAAGMMTAVSWVLRTPEW